MGVFGIDAVLVKEIDDAGLEALQRAFNNLLDMVGAAVGCCPFAAAVRVGFKAELGGDDDLIAERRESLTDEFLIDVWAVDFGRIEESDAAFNSGSNEVDGY